MNIEVIAISRDLQPAQQKFKETVSAKNTFLADPEAKVIGAYGALNALKISNRYYFLIDENGRLIRHTDAFNKTITYTHNLDTKQEIVQGHSVFRKQKRGNGI